VYDGRAAPQLNPKERNMPAKKTGASKKKLAPGKKAQKIKPLTQDFHFTKPIDTPSAKLG
jgi:hypothetical protein